MIHKCVLCGKEGEPEEEYVVGWQYVECADGDIYPYCPDHSEGDIRADLRARGYSEGLVENRKED